MRGIHSNDIAEILDSKGVCIRSGHHCCQPLHRYLGIKSTARVSMNFTTTEEDIDIFIVDGKFNTRNYKAVDWLCTKIENGQTNLILDIQEFEED